MFGDFLLEQKALRGLGAQNVEIVDVEKLG
jgi:hypothetical protein